MLFLCYLVNSFILLIETEERNDKTNLFTFSIIPISKILSTNLYLWLLNVKLGHKIDE